MTATHQDPGIATELCIEIRLLGQYAEMAGSRRVVLTVPQGATLGVVLRMLEAESTRGALRRPAVPEARFSDAVVFVNGRNAALDCGPDRALADGDSIVVTTPIGGG